MLDGRSRSWRWGWVIAVCTACTGATTAAPPPITEAPTPDAATVATASSAEAVKPPEPPAPKARRVSLPGLALSDFVAGRPPSTSAPLGSLFALAYEQPTGAKAFVVEIDVERGAELARATIADTDVRATLAREGDRLYALTKADATTPEVVVLDLALSIARRVPLGGAGAKKKPKVADAELRAFTVIDGRAIVLGSAGVAWVFEPSGKLVSERDCKASLFSPGRYDFVKLGARVLVRGLIDPEGESLRQVACAFDADGKGPVDRLVVTDAGGQLHVAPDGTLTLSGFDGEAPFVAPVDARLKVGPRTTPVAAEASAAPTVDACPGIEGDAKWQDEVVHGRRVVRTIRCCGGTSNAGIWVCPASP